MTSHTDAPGGIIPEWSPGKDMKRSERSARSVHNAAGTLWFGGWLFTVGLLRLVWWKAILALLVWPYFLGVHLR
jgi:hypothetical protein